MPHIAQMKIWLGLALTAALAVGLWSTGIGRMPTRVDNAAAAAAVRLYENDPTLVLPVPRIETRGREGSRRGILRFRLDDRREYEVDARTGRVFNASYPRPERGAGAKGEISPDRAEEIARTYAAEHFPDFMQKFIKARVIDGGAVYRVLFQQQVPGTGAELPNFAMIAIDVTTGAVWSVTIHDGNPIPAESAAAPAVSREEAIQIFARAAGMVSVTSVDTAQLRWIQHKGDRLIWTLMLRGIFPGRIHGRRGGAVDARTGSIISIGRPQTPDYRIVEGPEGPEMEIARGPAVPAAGSLDGGDGSSFGGLPPAAAAGLGSAALLALAAGAFHFFRRRGHAVTPASGAGSG